MPIRTPDEMRRAMRQNAPAPAWAPADPRAAYMRRIGAAMDGGRGARGGRMAPERMGPYVPAAMAGGALIGPPGPTMGSAQPAVEQRVVVGPGQGAPAAVVAPPSRARDEALTAAAQQHGAGVNYSQPLVPKEREVAAREFALARQGNPLADLPEAIDQRSAQYAKGADIAAWIEANKNAPKGADGMNIVERFLVKQRREANAVQEMPAGAKLMGGDGSEQGAVAYDPKRLAAYEQGANDQRSVDEAMASFTPRDMERNPLAAAAIGANGAAAAYSLPPSELVVAPKVSAQEQNLNFNSPLPAANSAQAEKGAKDRWLMSTGLPVLDKYKAMALNTYWRG